MAACFHEDWPLLVVCPSSMILTWLEGLNDWLPPHLLPDQDNLVVITAGKVSLQAEKQLIQLRAQQDVPSDALPARLLASFYHLYLAPKLNRTLCVFLLVLDAFEPARVMLLSVYL